MKTTFCVMCGDVKNLDHHHIIAKVNGGTDDPENLITLCQEHHGKLHQFRPGAWNNRKQLQAEGIAKAKAKGVYKGKPVTLNHDEMVKMFMKGISAIEISKIHQCSRAAVYKVLKNKGYTYDKATKEWKAPEIETIWCKMSKKWIIPKPKVTVYPTVVHKNTS
tara:strand:+ start:49 stop:537 length:489 start_codon:yes stop_codon:yes gene_type:complete